MDMCACYIFYVRVLCLETGLFVGSRDGSISRGSFYYVIAFIMDFVTAGGSEISDLEFEKKRIEKSVSTTFRRKNITALRAFTF